MRIILFILIFIGSLQIRLADSLKNIDRVFVIVKRNTSSDSNFYYHEIKDVTYGFRITFDIPNYTAYMTHTPISANHILYKHEEIKVTQQELLQSKVLFADKLTFAEWSDLEKFDKQNKIYMIFQEDYMTNDRFVLNHKFKALEVSVIADGPI